ncbi:MAG: YfhO family protein [Deltaproteobacteria bacterium]|nr:YfhO family protein [Deltaproteobacteria bacterium]
MRVFNSVGKNEFLKAFLFYNLVAAFAYSPVIFLGYSLIPSLYQPNGIVEQGAWGFEGRVPLNTFSIDFATPAYYEFPVNKLVGDLLKNGELPLWNPYQAIGTPLAAQYSTRALFPYQMLEDISPYWMWDFFMLFRLVIAGFFTFVFLRTLNLGFSSSFLGGVFYMLSGSFVWFINLEQMTNVAMLAPVLLLCMERLSASRAMRDVGLGAIVFGLVLLSGQPEVALYVLFLAGLYFAYRVGFDLRQFSRLALGFIIGLLIAAPLIFPFIELWANSLHIHPIGGDMGVRDTNPISRVVNLLVPTFRELPSLPEFSHHPLAETLDRFGKAHYTRVFPSNGEWDYLGGYSGVVVLFLTLSGILVTMFRGRVANSGLLVFFSAFGIAVVLKNFGVAPFLWLGYLPFFDQVWSQRWAGPAWTFALAVSGAIGFEMLKDNYQKDEAVFSSGSRIKDYLVARKILIIGLAVHILLFKLALSGAHLVFDSLVRFEEYTGFVIRSFYLPALAMFIAPYVFCLAKKGTGSIWLSARGYLYTALVSAVFLNLFVLVLSTSGILDLDSHVYIGRVVYLALNSSFVFLFLYIFLWRLVWRLEKRFEKPYVILLVSAVAIFAVFLVSRLNVAQGSFFAAPEIRPFYLPSIVMGQGVMISTLASAVILSVYLLKKGLAPYPMVILAILEFWFWVPRGYEPEWLLLKSAPFAFGVIVVFFMARERWGLALFSALGFLAAFLVVDSTARYGFPDRHDPFERPRYIDFLKKDKTEFRVMGIDGVLFPNYASVAGLHDIQFINSLVSRDYQDFRLNKLHSRVVSTETSSTLWFTGRPELHTVDEVSGIGVEDVPLEQDLKHGLRFYSLLGVKYILTPAAYTLEGFPLVYDREIRIYENKGALPRVFVVKDADDEASLSDAAPAKILEYRASRVEARAREQGGGMLVLADLWYPGWVAYIDGKKAKIHKVFGILRGVEISSGEHTVVFEYRPRSFYYGSLCFFAGLLIALYMALPMKKIKLKQNH